MPILNNVAKIAVKALPTMISPKAHSVLDCMVVGAFCAAASRFWKQNKRAAIAAMICGGAELAITFLTDYPAGVKRVIHYGARREIDLGLAAMTASMPEFLAFRDEPEKTFFIAQGMLISATTSLSRFPQRPERAEKEPWHRKPHENRLFAL